MYLLFINPLTHNFQLTGLKTICILIANVRKLSLYVSLCINCYNMNTKRATEKLILYYYSPFNSIKIALSAKLAVISKMKRYISLPCLSLSSLHSNRKQLYLVSTSYYQLSIKSISFLKCIQFWWHLKITWDKMADIYKALHQ